MIVNTIISFANFLVTNRNVEKDWTFWGNNDFAFPFKKQISIA
jgi:hypothetical protein